MILVICKGLLDYFHHGFLEQISGGVCACHKL